MKLAVVGPESSVAGFSALGVDAFPASSPGQAERVWDSMDTSLYAVIFVTEDLFETLRERIEAFRDSTYPVVTLLPAASGQAGSGVERLRELVERAVGTDKLLNA